MSTSLAYRPAPPHAFVSLTSVDDCVSLSLDDFPDLTGTLPEQILAWSEADDLRSIHVALADPDVIELPGEWQQPSDPLL